MVDLVDGAPVAMLSSQRVDFVDGERSMVHQSRNGGPSTAVIRTMHAGYRLPPLEELLISLDGFIENYVPKA